MKRKIGKLKDWKVEKLKDICLKLKRSRTYFYFGFMETESKFA
jgi:hypothetical protein